MAQHLHGQKSVFFDMVVVSDSISSGAVVFAVAFRDDLTIKKYAQIRPPIVAKCISMKDFALLLLQSSTVALLPPPSCLQRRLSAFAASIYI